MRTMYTYEDYLKEPQHIRFERMVEIHREIVEEIGQDEEALEIYGSLLVSAANYANTRARWSTMDRQEKLEKDSARTSQHDSFITKLNMLERLLRKQGKQLPGVMNLATTTKGTGGKQWETLLAILLL